MRQINNGDDASPEAATVGTSATVEEQVNRTDSMLRQHNIYDAKYYSDSDDLDDNSVAVISESDSPREVEVVNTHILFGNTETKALVHSGSVYTINNKNLAKAVIMNKKKESHWTNPSTFHDIKKNNF